MDEENNVLRLAKPKKKGLWRLIFSRFLIIGLLIVLQILLLIMLFGTLANALPFIEIIEPIFTIIVIFYLFNCKMDTSAKLTWLVVIALAPIPGAIFLIYCKLNVGQRSTTFRVSKLLEETKDAIVQNPKVIDDLKGDTSGTLELNHYINRDGCFPIYENTETTFFPIGEQKFQAMLVELEKAEKFIFMEYFIIEEGYMWGRILDILARKVKQGVDVRVMYDGLCEISTLPVNYPKLLENLGIKAKLFAPLTPFVSTHYNYRDHRKILVIDGNVGFNGGVNLADEYINKIERFGHWKDTAIMLKGAAVQSLTLMFLQMWNITEKEADFSQAYIPAIQGKTDGFVMPYGDSPLDDDKVGESVYMDILYKARRYVHIMTPYLILDGELQTALKYAAERGVDVKIILPGIPDKGTAYSLAKSHYSNLIASNVKIYEYSPGFVHAKVVASDDERAVVGTINFDYRSLYHHFECATYMYKTSCIADIEKDFQATLEKCRVVTPETIKNEKFSYKLKGAILKLFAPLF